jgi:alkylated DNA repair protein alkB family protein 8
LQRRSLLVMAGEARYLWTHGIAARQCDEVHSEMPGYIGNYRSTGSQSSRASTATILPRGTRVSLTFRKVRGKPCICDCSKYSKKV